MESFSCRVKKMQTYVNSIFIPVGLTQDIQVKDVFSRQGQLRGTESIYILENLLDFMLLACSIPDAYKQFFSMLSSDVCKMSAHLIKDDNEVNDLFLCTAETISTHEAMFPIFLSDFVYHQLVDIVPHIKCQGPQQHYSTLAGERMNAVIKRFAKTCGGQNATHTVLTNYMHAETYRTENAYSDELEKKICCNSLHESLNANAILIKNSSNGKVVRRIFNDLKCHMQADKISRCDLVDYEFASLVSVLLFEVEKQTKSIDDATSKSSLYCCYTKWFATSGRPKASKVSNHDAFSLWIVENKGSDVEDFHSKNVLKELLQLKYSLFTKVYQKCTIFGVLFSSRGLEYRIQEEQSFVTDMESIRNNWTDSCQYSSWCRHWSKSVSNPEFSEEQDGTNFSQINCFMRVKLPSDFILNGLPLASIAPRKHKEYRRFPRFDVDLDNIDGLKNLFAVVTNFVPSRVMIVGFDTNELSYEFKEHVIKQDKTKIYYSTQPYSSVKYFCLLSATRKNEGIKYNGSHCGFYNEFEEE